MTQSLACLVVAYGRPDLLETCLTSLSWCRTVTVVDNSRSDDIEAVSRRHGVRYLRPERNLGFAGGVNMGLATIPDDDVLLVNPDAELDESSALRMHALLRAGGVAAVAPRLVHPDGAEERATWPFPSPLGTWAGAFGLADRLAAPEFLSGAVLLLSRPALEALGGFDERFFLYAEEADWQRRARDAGWRLVLCREALATHVGAGTSSDPRVRETLFHASAEMYARKWFGSGGWMIFRIGALVSALRRATLTSDREIRKTAWLVARLYLRGPVRASRPVRQGLT